LLLFVILLLLLLFLIISVREVMWKRAVHEVREMCDSCETTIFNVHWACARCGYVTCLDCYMTVTRRCCMRCNGSAKCGCIKWLKCGERDHEPEQLLLTQVIPSDGKLLSANLIWHISHFVLLQKNAQCPSTVQKFFLKMSAPSMFK